MLGFRPLFFVITPKFLADSNQTTKKHIFLPNSSEVGYKESPTFEFVTLFALIVK